MQQSLVIIPHVISSSDAGFVHTPADHPNSYLEMKMQTIYKLQSVPDDILAGKRIGL
jgi:hypothetical protein